MVLAGHPDLTEELVEELARAAHERQALPVLLGARGLADEHEVRVGVAHAEDRVRTHRAERARSARAHLVVHLDQLLAAVGGCEIGHSGEG